MKSNEPIINGNFEYNRGNGIELKLKIQSRSVDCGKKKFNGRLSRHRCKGGSVESMLAESCTVNNINGSNQDKSCQEKSIFSPRLSSPRLKAVSNLFDEVIIKKLKKIGRGYGR